MHTTISKTYPDITSLPDGKRALLACQLTSLTPCCCEAVSPALPSPALP